MKQSIPQPVAVGLIVVVALVAVFFLWRAFFAQPRSDFGGGPYISGAENRKAMMGRAQRSMEADQKFQAQEAQRGAQGGQ